MSLAGTDVFQDEYLLTRPDEAELAAGDLFDGPGVVAQAPRLIGQPRVLHALVRDGAGQLVILAPRAERRHQPAVADERVEHNHADDTSGWPTGRPCGRATRLARSVLLPDDGARSGLRHWAGTVHQIGAKYNHHD